MKPADSLYIFLDEGGNFDFSATGSRYFTLTTVTTTEPTCWDAELAMLKYSLIEGGENLEYFHATEDRQTVRDQVFTIIQGHLQRMRLDTLVVEKRKTRPAIRDFEELYPRMLGYLLRYVLRGHPRPHREVVIITDRIPVNKKRTAIEKAVKQALASWMPPNTHYCLFHHASMSSYGLQVADYCNWAIGIKWERGEMRSHILIQPAIHSEFDIFWRGTRLYY